MAEGDDLEHRIRERAYALWQQAGSPDGRQDEFWHQARQELSGDEHGGGDRETVRRESEESFPASDAPSTTGMTGPGR